MNQKKDDFTFFMLGIILACMVIGFLSFVYSGWHKNQEVSDVEYVFTRALSETHPKVHEQYTKFIENGRITYGEFDDLVELWHREEVKSKYGVEAQ